MTIANTKAAAETPIRELMEDWAKALRAKQIEGVMSHYARNVLSFDLLPPLQYAGATAYRKNYEEWFQSFQGPIGYEIRDLSICGRWRGLLPQP